MNRLHSLAVATLSIIALSACATNAPIPNPQPGWAQATGQIQSTGGTVPIVGEIVIRHDRENFLAEVTKGPGLPLLKIYGKGQHGEQVTARGALARGSWSGSPTSAPKPLKAWSVLPGVFQFAQGKARGDRSAAVPVMDVKITRATPTAIEYERAGEKIICHLQQ